MVPRRGTVRPREGGELPGIRGRACARRRARAGVPRWGRARPGDGDGGVSLGLARVARARSRSAADGAWARVCGRGGGCRVGGGAVASRGSGDGPFRVWLRGVRGMPCRRHSCVPLADPAWVHWVGVVCRGRSGARCGRERRAPAGLRGVCRGGGAGVSVCDGIPRGRGCGALGGRGVAGRARVRRGWAVGRADRRCSGGAGRGS